MKKTIDNLLFLMIFIPTFLFGQSSLKGTVSEQESGIPLPGVNVVIKGSNTGTTTDFNGNYEIDVESGDVLVFSYVGFTSFFYAGFTTFFLVLTNHFFPFPTLTYHMAQLVKEVSGTERTSYNKM